MWIVIIGVKDGVEWVCDIVEDLCCLFFEGFGELVEFDFVMMICFVVDWVVWGIKILVNIVF